jgi:hypothetical protein
MTGLADHRARRPSLVCALASALVPVAVFPHIVEDIAAGEFERFGLGAFAAAAVVGAIVAAQMLAALAALHYRRSGYAIVLLLATLWIVAVVLDHPEAFVPGEFTAGFGSRLAIWGIVAIQALAALGALSAWRGTRRTSFAGTGSWSVRR